ncbi:hypothetical protein IC235_18215 [Hymenobacter sp. BT664]|uniref:Uncharacterized protein n=1 Tax=Hymenobacter montanus TaxID=2771359 RepID=A0A927BH63_9BACT|nr:hypothetical protein [Hymenobacter montanus]MBD2769828.1 hypothetical protein [Hymenobacter montanus]
MKKLFAMGACLLALMGNPIGVYAGDTEVVVVRVYEAGQKGEIVLTGPNGRKETVLFESGAGTKKLAAAGKAYHAVVTKLYQEGYGLTSTFTTSGNGTTRYNITTLIFTKGD